MKTTRFDDELLAQLLKQAQDQDTSSTSSTDPAVKKVKKKKRRKKTFKEGTQASLEGQGAIIKASRMDLSSIRLTSISSSIKIVRLDLSHNQLKSLAGLEALRGETLKHLVISNNQLTRLDVTGFTGLEVIDARHNRIRQVAGLADCASTLHTLLLNRNELSDLDWICQPFAKLTALTVSQNFCLAVKKKTKIKKQKQSLDAVFQCLPALEKLCIARCIRGTDTGAALTKAPAMLRALFQHCPELRELRANGNAIKDEHLPKIGLMKRAKKLSLLDLGSNELKDLGALLPLLSSCFPQLTVLRLFANPLCSGGLATAGGADRKVKVALEYNESTVLSFLPRVATLDMRKVRLTTGAVAAAGSASAEGGGDVASDKVVVAKRRRLRRNDRKTIKREKEEDEEEKKDEGEDAKMKKAKKEKKKKTKQKKKKAKKKRKAAEMEEVGQVDEATETTDADDTSLKKKAAVDDSKPKKKKRRKIEHDEQEIDFVMLKKMIEAKKKKEAKEATGDEKKEDDAEAATDAEEPATKMKEPVFEIVEHRLPASSKNERKLKEKSKKLDALKMLLGGSERSGAASLWD